MFATAPEGELDKRTLESDDIAGLCEIYPAQSNAATCAPTEYFFDRALADTQAKGSDTCQVAPLRTQTQSSRWGLGALFLLGMMVWRRRSLNASRR